MEQRADIGIIGVNGSFGSWFRAQLSKHGYSVCGCDVDTELRLEDIVSMSDVVLACAPIAVSESIIRKTLELMSPDQLFVDIVSIKSIVSAALSEARSEVLSIHPMFSPTVGTAAGQTVVLCELRKGTRSAEFVGWLRSLEVKLISLSLQEHDELMAVVQGLTHFISVSLASTLAAAKIDPEYTLQVTSPVYRIQLDLVGRILSQKMELYRDIALGNPYNVATIETFLKVAESLLAAIRNGDEAAYAEVFNTAAQHFDKTAAHCFDESNKLIETFAKSLHEETRAKKD